MIDLIKKKYLAVEASDSVSRLIGQLELKKAKAAIVFDKRKYLGVADTHLLVRTKVDPATMKVRKIVKKVPKLTGKESLEETARLLFTGETRILPVIEDKQVVGVVNAMDVILQLQGTSAAKKKISEIMSLKPVTVHENDPMGKAVAIMREKHISRVPIVDDKGYLVNIAALTDMLCLWTLRQQGKSEDRGRGAPTRTWTRTIRAFRQRIDFNTFPIKNLSTSIMITAAPEDTLGRTIDKMERFDISSIVIIEEKKPVGIITTRDLLRLFLKKKVTL